MAGVQEFNSYIIHLFDMEIQEFSGYIIHLSDMESNPTFQRGQLSVEGVQEFNGYIIYLFDIESNLLLQRGQFSVAGVQELKSYSAGMFHAKIDPNVSEWAVCGGGRSGVQRLHHSPG